MKRKFRPGKKITDLFTEGLWRIDASLSAEAIASIVLKCRASVLAVFSPTYLIPNAKRTLSKGTFLDLSRLAMNFSTDFSCQPARLSSEYLLTE